MTLQAASTIVSLDRQGWWFERPEKTPRESAPYSNVTVGHGDGLARNRSRVFGGSQRF